MPRTPLTSSAKAPVTYSRSQETAGWAPSRPYPGRGGVRPRVDPAALRALFGIVCVHLGPRASPGRRRPGEERT